MFSPAIAWREYPQKYRLEAARCTGCGKILYPPRVVCPECRCRDFETVTLPRTGKIVTFTVVRVPPSGFADQSPLPIALVALDNGVRLLAPVGGRGDVETLHIGMKVRLEFRRISSDGEAGVIFYGHKAVTA